jgi:predicted small lipoprotein YifL
MKEVFLTLMIVAVLMTGFMGCGRETPPEIPDFRIPPKIALIDSTVPEIVTDPSGPMGPVPTPLPKQTPTKPPVAVVKAKVAQAPPPTQVPEAPAAPSIVGTWKVMETSFRGQAHPMPAGMQMIFTFGQDGSLNMSMSGGQLPQPQTQQGSYSLTGNQITLTMQNHSQSGTCTFDGNDKITIEIGEGKTTMARQ